MEYTQEVINHFTNPQNAGVIENADAVGEVGNIKCGDIMRLYLKIEDGLIKNAKFKTFGCTAAVATSSVLTILIIGKTLREASQIGNKDVLKALGGLPDAKIHCSCLAEEALQAALKDYNQKEIIDT
jgi:nitrogen fixation NifU-like protein